MILAGDDHYGTLLTVAEAQTQLSIWSIMASPLIMSSDLRTVKAEYKEVLLNKEMIKVSTPRHSVCSPAASHSHTASLTSLSLLRPQVNQDAMGKAGLRVGPNDDNEVWVRELDGGDIAVALYNKADTARAFMRVKMSALGLQIPASATYKVSRLLIGSLGERRLLIKATVQGVHKV
jgi:hypothetical protein